jgi:hypothetical protein
LEPPFKSDDLIELAEEIEKKELIFLNSIRVIDESLKNLLS